MNLVSCPHCNIRVVPLPDGQCPSCRQSINERILNSIREVEKLNEIKPAPGQDALQTLTTPTPEPASASPYAGLAQKIRPLGSASRKEFESREPVVTVIRSEEDYPNRGAFLNVFNLYRFSVTLFDFQVVIDGDVVASLSEGDRIETSICPGEHTIWIANKLSSSPAVPFSADRGQRVRFACNAKTFGLMLRRLG